MQLQDQLQSVLNAAARFVSAGRSERITPLLRELHWLRVPERVTTYIPDVRQGFIYTPSRGCTPPCCMSTPLAMTPSSPDRLSCMFIDTLLQCNQ